MKALVGFKFKEDFSDRAFIERACAALERRGVATMVMVRDVEKWGAVSLSPEALMQEAFSAIDAAETVILEFSEKGVGLGIEAGYARAKNKPLVLVVRIGTDISVMAQGIATKVIFYNTPEEWEGFDLSVA